ncbi:MAG: hypothetical protein PHN72_04490 [Bacilli bacterium]|nr:hypothetical protein [Bacilli bacterium]
MKSADDFKIKMILGLFTVDKGKLKVLLFKKAGEPYKGYWVLPWKPFTYNETFQSNTDILIKEHIGLDEVYTETFKAFDDKETVLTDPVVHVTTIGLTDIASASYQRKEIEGRESDWFPLESLPKLAYNHEEVLESMFTYLKRKLRDSEMISLLFPSDFTLPELQTFCEQIEGKELDRRNFRKKILALSILEDTGDKSESASGRPARLYKFKEGISQINLF